MLKMKRTAGQTLTLTVIKIERVGSSVVELAIDAPPEVRIDRDPVPVPQRGRSYGETN